MDPVIFDYLIQCDPVPPIGFEGSRVAIVANHIGSIEFVFEAVILEEVQAGVQISFRLIAIFNGSLPSDFEDTFTIPHNFMSSYLLYFEVISIFL